VIVTPHSNRRKPRNARRDRRRRPVLVLVPTAARAHCDTLDGPVVKTARDALDAKDVRPVLACVAQAH
jgi:hypothetical protein